jgi:hypothetical protein
MKRTTSFGYGGRYDFSFKGVSPSPGRYNLPALFNGKDLSGRCFTFGIAREAYSKVYAKEGASNDASIPGPGTYEVRSKPGTDSTKFSFRPKTSNCSNLMNNRIVEAITTKTPGPGTYQQLSAISKRGNQYVSHFESSKASTFNPPCSTRFKDRRIKPMNYTILAASLTRLPGPGHYNQPPVITQNGSLFCSKYKSSQSRRFGQEERVILPCRDTNIRIEF